METLPDRMPNNTGFQFMYHRSGLYLLFHNEDRIAVMTATEAGTLLDRMRGTMAWAGQTGAHLPPLWQRQ